MIVYVFINNFFKKIFLPSKIVGVYPICIIDNKVLVNLEAKDGQWYINPAEHVQITLNGYSQENPKLELNNIYIISTNKYYVYLTSNPLCMKNKNLLKPLRKEFSFGSSQNNDLCYTCKEIKDTEFKVVYNENGYWMLNSFTKNVYLNDKLVTNSILRTGDHIFCFGIRLVYLGNSFMMDISSNLKINKNSLITVDSFSSSVDKVKGEYELSDDTPLYDKNDYFIKSPRFISDSSAESINIDAPPAEEKKDTMPIIFTLGPQLTMMSMSLLSVSSTIVDFTKGKADTLRFVSSMLTVFAMLAGIMVWPLLIKKYQKKQLKKKEMKRVEKYREYLNSKKEKIHNTKLNIKSSLFEEYPTCDKCKNVIEAKKAVLWKKNIDDSDFLTVGLGIGTVPSDIKINMPDEHFSLEEEDKLMTDLKNVVEDSKYIDDAPFTFSLTSSNISAIIGEKVLCDKLLDDIFLQIMAFHPYSDLKIIVFTSPENAQRWEYLKILPHCWNNQHTTRYFATSIEEFNEITSSIDSIFDSRKENDDNEKLEDNGKEQSFNDEPYKSYKPYFLVFTDNIGQIRNVSLVKKILNYKKNLGFSILIENDRLSTLPDQTDSFISVNKDVSGLFTKKIKLNDKNGFKIDFNNRVDMYHCAQLLANIPILLEKDKYELPKSLTFLEMFNVGRIEQLNSMERWKNNNPVNSLSVPVGIDQNGEIFKMDLHEKVYGPHGLVAGTTGSGKSEWIVTFILSLAVNFNPDEVQFVLVDYKGGGLAMSFENKELGIKLPHLAGTITNLDKSAINRSIASIESELKRRQSIFNDAREKLKEGQMDIYKYQQFYRKGMVNIPLSHLFIICDEFAELKQQQPEFMEQLISTSRIGRSLGVHLILATQKPSGVVNDQIWSNSRFKVCLRVQDKADSNEILKKPDAAYLKQVGAFYLEVGNDEYYNLGQSAWAGAKYYPSDIVKKTVDQSVQHIDNTGKIVNYFDEQVTNVNQQASQGEELLNVVKYIDEISKEESYVKQQLWLPNIPENIYLTDIKNRYEFKPKQLDFTTVIGEYDEPRKQEQNILTINLAEGNIAIVGQPGSGKEMLLSTIIFSSIAEHTPKEINYYILDFGAETLRKFAKFPHVGEVVFQSDMERVGGVIQLIFEEIAKRKDLFQDYNGSLDYYNKHSGNILPLICLVINAYDVFGELLMKVVDSLNSMFRDAPRYGIIFILSASAQNTFKPRILQYFNRYIIMNLQDESQYRNLTNCRKGLIPSNCYGRGICKVTDDDDSYSEFQTAHIIDEEKELEYLKKIAEFYSKNYTTKAKKIMTIPDNVTSEDLAKFVTTIANIPIGYNFYEKDICKVDFSNIKIYPIITKDLSKTMAFVYALANLFTKLPNTVVRVIDIAKKFDKPILDIKFFQDDLKVVFAALAKDTVERTETQPLAINIVLGAASFKSRLDKTGIEYVDQMFNGMANAKQNIYILIDDYKNFRTLKLMPWYNAMDTSNGIWLGPGIESQSVLQTNELSQEDKKYVYEGMAYLINNGNYTLIKTMMDGDD